jgi:hypothetical protein
VVALCKVALLLATLEAAAPTPESSGEFEECVKIELANLQQGAGIASRQVSPVCHSVRGAQDRGRAHGNARLGMPHARTDGHRLANGLCAPRQC